MGQRLSGGEVIELSSDLGGGKTTFVKGLAEGMGSKDHISSPTFTICNVYNGRNNLKLWHYDFYRLPEPGLMEHELAEALSDKKSIIVVEWAQIVRGVLPLERLTVRIRPTGEDSRLIDFTCPPSLAYLLGGIK